ncbi:sugar ABC transporter ATP-binding protein [Paenibacillus thalictri]|uniref:sugar ABC transporter ATP-binding protein n=1 Tax=Paenibacillus thalictri TaxID=2527873 RepID=UPI001981A1AA|nr:sugar ABC transporter ATP-binding protein [Paenibacillus thalictri]
MNQVSFELQPGEVHALCGENGAGKSTLMRIIAGVEHPDDGELSLDGVPITHFDEHKANVLGIGMVHQERSLVPGLSIAENIFAARQPLNRFGLIDKKKMNQRGAELLSALKLEVDPTRLVSTLSPAQQQMVEIAKALSHDLKLLILDEPSAALTIAETEDLFEVIRQLTRQGVSIVYISHRLAEVFTISDRVTVMKDGEVTGTFNTNSVTEDQLIKMMVGRELTMEQDLRRVQENAEVVLEVSELRSAPAVQNASLQVRAGEIVCLAGLVGAGRTELCEALFGVREYTRGEIVMNGTALRMKSPSDAMKYGMGMVPEDRKEGGLFLEMSIMENIVSSNLSLVSSGAIVSSSKSKALSKLFVDKLRIATPSVSQKTVNLSGGNQQKVLLSKWLARKPKLLIIDEPTKGVDVGARSDIYAVLRELAASGIALLVVSSDLPEVLSLAHRIVVMSEGRTVGELDASEATELSILKLASPGSIRKEKRTS